MRANVRSRSFPKLLFVFVFLLLVLFKSIPPLIFPSHERSLQLTVKSPNFTYKVTTFRNNKNNRCALLRCGPETFSRFSPESDCDIVFLEISSSPGKRSARLCPVDYIHSQWDSLSRTYNEGFLFVDDSAVLSVAAEKLPLDPSSVHFASARNHFDISVAWFSVWPSNATQAVFQAWNSAVKQTTVQHDAPEYVSLNRARTCHSPDITCHPRSSSIAWQCDNARRQTICTKTNRANRAITTVFITLILIFILAIVLATLAEIIPRLRPFLRTQRLDFNLSSVPLVPMLCAVLIIMLAGEHWVVIVRIIARAFGATFVHKLQPAHLTTADIYRAVPDLRGMYTGYSYIYRDGNDMVRISGPWISAVVNLVSLVLFVRRIFFNGLLVTCLFWTIIVRLTCSAMLIVAGRSKQNSLAVEDDEYVTRRSEIPSSVLPRECGRAFVPSRGRDSIVTVIDGKGR